MALSKMDNLSKIKITRTNIIETMILIVKLVVRRRGEEIEAIVRRITQGDLLAIAPRANRWRHNGSRTSLSKRGW